MVAVCQAEEFHATALAKSSAGTRFATSEAAAGPKKARAMPKNARVTKTPAGDVRPRTVRISSATAHAASRTVETAITSLRPNRSEAVPVTSTSSSAGANWMSPT